MSALPKRKTSRSRRGHRRAHGFLLPPNLVPCPQCHSLKLPHVVCPSCGSYQGREVLVLKSKKRREH